MWMKSWKTKKNKLVSQESEKEKDCSNLKYPPITTTQQQQKTKNKRKIQFIAGKFFPDTK